MTTSLYDANDELVQYLLEKGYTHDQIGQFLAWGFTLDELAQMRAPGYVEPYDVASWLDAMVTYDMEDVEALIEHGYTVAEIFNLLANRFPLGGIMAGLREGYCIDAGRKDNLQHTCRYLRTAIVEWQNGAVLTVSYEQNKPSPSAGLSDELVRTAISASLREFADEPGVEALVQRFVDKPHRRHRDFLDELLDLVCRTISDKSAEGGSHAA
jgi:hypothetical protein